MSRECDYENDPKIFDDREATFLERLTNLKELNISGNDVVPTSIYSVVASCNQLEALYLNHTTCFGEKALTEISKLPNLTKLSASKSLIEPFAVPYLVNMKQLKYLSLAGSKPITEMDINIISKQRPDLQMF